MKWLRTFENFKHMLPDFKDKLPNEITIHTNDGNFTLKKSDVTLESDIVRVTYHHSTLQKNGNSLAEKNVEIKIVEEVIIKDNFDDARIELDVRSIEVVNRSFEEYDSISTSTITDLTDTITNLSKNYSRKGKNR